VRLMPVFEIRIFGGDGMRRRASIEPHHWSAVILTILTNG
jgi:hypothetical protein